MINIDDGYTEIATEIQYKNRKKYPIKLKEKERHWNLDSSHTYKSKYNIIDMKFEIKNIDDIKENQQIFETLYNQYLIVGYKRISKPIRLEKTKELGSFLLEIMNNYDKIKNIILLQYIELSQEAKNDWENKNLNLKDQYANDYNSYIQERKQLDLKLINTCYTIYEILLDLLGNTFPNLDIFSLSATDYMIEAYNSYKIYTENLKADVRINKKFCTEHPYTSADKMTEKQLLMHKNLPEEIKELAYQESIDCILQTLENSVKSFADDLLYGKNLIEKTFIHNKDNIDNRNKKFSGIETNLPIAKIEYAISEYLKYPKPYKYTYKIKNIKDIYITTLYQLSLSHKVIMKCKYCGKYSIPERTDKMYCDTDCKQAYFRKQSEKNSNNIYDYYRKLYNRYKNTKSYSKDFEELKKIYYNQYKTKQIDDETFMTILLDFEEKVKSTHNLQRGRPKKKQNM